MRARQRASAHFGSYKAIAPQAWSEAPIGLMATASPAASCRKSMPSQEKDCGQLLTPVQQHHVCHVPRLAACRPRVAGSRLASRRPAAAASSTGKECLHLVREPAISRASPRPRRATGVDSPSCSVFLQGDYEQTADETSTTTAPSSPPLLRGSSQFSEADTPSDGLHVVWSTEFIATGLTGKALSREICFGVVCEKSKPKGP